MAVVGGLSSPARGLFTGLISVSVTWNCLPPERVIWERERARVDRAQCFLLPSLGTQHPFCHILFIRIKSPRSAPTPKEVNSIPLLEQCQRFGGCILKSPYPYFFAYSFISIWTRGFYFISWVINPLLPLFIALLKLALSAGSCVILPCPHHSWSVSLFSGITRCSRLNFYFSCPSPGSFQ